MPRAVPGVCCEVAEHHPGIQVLPVASLEYKPTHMNVLGFNAEAYQVRVHRNCVHNQYKALAERHIKDRSYIGFDLSFWKDTKTEFTKILKFMKTFLLKPLAKEQIPLRYSGGKRKVYERAAQNLDRGLCKKHWRVRMFVKPDKHPLCTIMDKAPRAIQYRSPEFNIVMAQYLVPIEEKLYEFDEIGKGCRVFAKGRNMQQRAADIIEIYESFEDPVVVELDHSKFDSCINTHHLKTTHKLYLKLFRSKQLYHCLHKQLENKGMSDNLRYKVTATRMSGDFDTALGNSFVNFLVLYAWMRKCDVEGHAYIDGDDSLIFVERKELHKLDFTLIKKYGFDSTWQIKDLITAEFCQGHVIRSEPPILVRNPYRILSHYNVCLKNYGATTWPKLMRGKALCEFMANQGVPYLMDFFRNMISGDFMVPVEDRYRWSVVRGHALGKVTEQAYQDMYEAFGFGIEQAILFNTPSTYAQIRKLGGHTVVNSTKSKVKNVLADESLRRAWEGFQSMAPSRGLCSGTGCSCVRGACSGPCSERVLRTRERSEAATGPPTSDCAGAGTSTGSR